MMMRHPPKESRAGVKKTDKILREEAVAAQFAQYAETIRRISFMYFTRPVKEEDDAEIEARDHSFSPMKQNDALLAFAKDFDISPMMLMNEEVRKAVVETRNRRLEYINRAASNDRILIDFITVCSEMVAAKRPFRNIMGNCSPAQKVAAMLAYLSLDQERYIDDIISSRFKSVNELLVKRNVAEQEVEKLENERRQNEEFAKQGLRSMWEQVQQVFLYFCNRPPPPPENLHQNRQHEIACAPDEDSSTTRPLFGKHSDTNVMKKDVASVNRDLLKPRPDRRRVIQLKMFQTAVQRVRHALRTQAKDNRASIEFLAEDVSKSPEESIHKQQESVHEAEIRQLMLPLQVFKPKSNLRPSEILFGGGGIDPDTGGLPGSIVSDLLERAWDNWGQTSLIEELESSRPFSLETEDDISQTRSKSLRIELPLPELLRWKYSNVDNITPLASQSTTPAPDVSSLSPGLKRREISAKQNAQNVGKQSQKTQQQSKASTVSGTLTGSRNRPSTSSPRINIWGLKGQAAPAAGQGSFPAKIVLNERTKDHLRRPKLGSVSSNTDRKDGVFRSSSTSKQLDAKSINWDFEHTLFLERGGKWTDLPESGVTRVTIKDKVLHERVEDAWKLGPTPHDTIFNIAAFKIQSTARKFIARKKYREGVFLSGARSAWLDANPPPPLWSSEATVTLGELLSLARIFSIIPTVLSESMLIDVTIQALKHGKRIHPQEHLPRKAARLSEAGFTVNWKTFQHICAKLADIFAKHRGKERHDLGTRDSQGLVALFDFFTVLLEGDGSHYDPLKPREWVRYIEKERKMHVDPDNKGLRRANTELADIERGHASIKASGTVAKLTDANGGKPDSKEEQIQRRLFLLGYTSEASEYYANACIQNGVDPESGIAQQLSENKMDISHYDVSGRKLFAFVDSISRSSCITHLRMSDARLDGDSMDILCKALQKNSSVTLLDVSENEIGLKGAEALKELVANSERIVAINLAGTGITDGMFDIVFRDGIEKNSHLETLDLSYNLLSDSCLFHLEHMILEKSRLQRMDLSWNLFSPGGVNSMIITNTERTKPRSRRGALGFSKPLPKLNLVADSHSQRHNLAQWMSVNGQVQVRVQDVEMTASEFISMDVALRIRSLTDLQRCSLIRLFTEGKTLHITMAKQLLTLFWDSDENMRSLALHSISSHVHESLRHELEFNRFSQAMDENE